VDAQAKRAHRKVNKMVRAHLPTNVAWCGYFVAVMQVQVAEGIEVERCAARQSTHCSQWASSGTMHNNSPRVDDSHVVAIPRKHSPHDRTNGATAKDANALLGKLASRKRVVGWRIL